MAAAGHLVINSQDRQQSLRCLDRTVHSTIELDEHMGQRMNGERHPLAFVAKVVSGRSGRTVGALIPYAHDLAVASIALHHMIQRVSQASSPQPLRSDDHSSIRGVD